MCKIQVGVYMPWVEIELTVRVSMVKHDKRLKANTHTYKYCRQTVCRLFVHGWQTLLRAQIFQTNQPVQNIMSCGWNSRWLHISVTRKVAKKKSQRRWNGTHSERRDEEWRQTFRRFDSKRWSWLQNFCRNAPSDSEVLLHIKWLQNIRLHCILACPNSEHLSSWYLTLEWCRV